MSERDFVQEVLNDLRAQFEAKNKEYKGATNDRWRNFSQGGELQSETPEQTLLGYVSKQVVNLFDAKKHNPERLTDVAFINEKAGDIAVYMIILMSMVREKAVLPPLYEVDPTGKVPPREVVEYVDRVFRKHEDWKTRGIKFDPPAAAPKILTTEEQREVEAKGVPSL